MNGPQPIAWLAPPGAFLAGAAGVPLVAPWGHPDALGLPLSDRGLLLADGLFETLLVAGGKAWLLAEHLERWHQSAALLGMAPPPGRTSLEPLIAEAIARSGLGLGRGALRLNWSRGSSGRGLDLPSGGDSHRFWLQLSPWSPSFQPLRVLVSRREQRNAASVLSRCKTFAYASAIEARREARAAGADDALLASTAGGLSGGTAATLLLRQGGHWLTPPLTSGCLPGVMRAQALQQGLAREAPLAEPQLLASEGALLLNSLGCRPLWWLGQEALPVAVAPATAAALWRRLRRGGNGGRPGGFAETAPLQPIQ